MAYGTYGYGGYPGPGGYYAPPMPDQLAQLRGAGQYQPQIMPQQPMMQGQGQQQPQTQPVMPQQAVQPVQAQPQPTILGPYYVSGDAGARGFLVGAGNTVLLFDADPDANVFWLKSADAAGMPSMRTFDYNERINSPKTAQDAAQTTPVQNVEYVLRSDFEALSAKYDAIAAELETLKNKSCKCATKKAKEDVDDG